ncbi:SusC/RagA family TonB-linked outer membrane protein [Pedobacter nyackensis]|uniref:TonB-linked outer membrane protein, SusC/RagA family n=1 Tax=Pedobacter nyackensis TaxID=475255 RepID=A0A1W2F878_9SPHI|nr:TonB-dependent receptor [Pedobacter nyackensis]SMD18157.1 TonB-linked outer membrane protein, SusC/RagA family [Pedobacter nyackensis]
MKEKLTNAIVRAVVKKSIVAALIMPFALSSYGKGSVDKIRDLNADLNNNGSTLFNAAKIIKGIVTDNQNQPLPGVSVVLKGTSIAAMSNTKGEFQISIPDNQNNAVLVFTYIGFATKEVAVGSQQVINVKLAEAVNAMDEVVVIGYGSIKKSSLTASVSKVTNDNLDQVPSGRPETALVGKMAGVNISQTRSTPGAAPVIKIRGTGSIRATNEPLIVIDGFPGGSLDQINMNDVESFEVLKDASSAAIYGSRASGGVIIVTTKKGKTGAPKLKLNAYYGIAKPMLHDDWITGEEYYNYVVKYQNRELVWDGGDPSTGLWNDPARLAKYQVNPIIKEGKQTIWQDEVTQNAPSQSYNLAVSGGNESVKYYISGTYNGEEGVIKTSNYQFYGFRANVDVKVNKTIDMGLVLNPSFNKRRLTTTMVNLAKYPSFVEPQNPDGTYPRARDYWGANVTGQANPNGILNGTQNLETVTNNTGEAFVGLNIIEGLRLRSSLGANLVNQTSDVFAATYTGNASSGSAFDIRRINVLNENTLTYNRTFNKVHDFTGLLGASYQKTNYRRANLVANANSFNNDILYTLDNAIINPTGSYTTKSAWGLVSYFSRVNYAYKSKYLFSASMRADGSSRFGPDNKWGYFPSASLGWRVTEEGFMKNIPAVSNLKLRGSYGVTGNFNIGDFEYLGKITSVPYSPGNVLTKGQAQTTLENLKLKWERTKGYDVGLDLGLFDNRINITVDYYDKRTTDMLYDDPVSALTGFPRRVANIGSVNNKGIELELRTVNFKGAFNWETSFNVAHNKNSVVDLGSLSELINTDTFGMGWILREGESLFSYYGYRAIGVIKDAQDLANSIVLPGSKIGNPKYEDVNKDGKISPLDRVILGNYQPKVTLGMTNNFSYKNFDLSVSMQSALGAKMYTFENQYFQGNVLGAMRRSLVETQWWSPQEPGDGRMPAAALSQLNFQGQSDIYLENASFFAIRNLNLGYNLPAELARKLRLSSIRVYSSINNLLVVTDKGFHGYNPEGYTQGDISGSLSMPGYNQNGSEPLNRVYTLGLNVGF